MSAAQPIAEDADAATPDTPGTVSELILPRFLVRREDGLFVDLAQFRESAEFRRLIERLMAAGYLFRGIEYRAFSALMFDYPAPAVRDELARCREAGREALIRWAGSLDTFEPVRAALYRKVYFEDGCAYYLFEPICLAPGDATGTASAEAVPTRLDVDEFVVQMWLKGLRAGLDIEAIRDHIEHDHYGRGLIARTIAPEPGTNATVQELWNGLHRDDRPRVLADGRADLTQFSNRFPQVEGGVRLLRKVPPVPGRPGRDVRGDLLVPDLASDFDLADLAGAGTRVEQADGEQYLVAEMDGFLDIDADSNQISISENIVHRQGVSVRTTGDLALKGDHFEEFGEIQERRTVEGKSITAHADVYGNIVSTGGEVRLEKNLSGGSAVNRDGPVIVEGLVVNAWVHAPRGEIRLKRAEGAVISGRHVVIEQAIACEIYGDSIDIAEVQGCIVAGNAIRIERAGTRRANTTTVQVVLPQTAPLRKRLAALREDAAELEDEIRRLARHRTEMLGEEELNRYLQLSKRLRSGELKLKPEQRSAVDALARKLAPRLKECSVLSGHIDAIRARREEVEGATAALERQLQDLHDTTRCVIGMVEDGVVIRVQDAPEEGRSIGALAANELKAVLRSANAGGRVLPHADGQAFAWRAGEADAHRS